MMAAVMRRHSLFLADQLATAGRGQRVEARAAIVVGGPPFGGNEPALLEPLQRRIERAVLDEQHTVGLRLDGAGDALAVLRAEDQRAQDEQIERALQMGGVCRVGALSDRHSTQVFARLGSTVNPKVGMSKRRRSPDDFAAEVQAHLELETDRLMAEGLDPDAARAAAHRRFGNATRVRETFYDSTRPLWFDQAWIDVRAALRSIARYPLAAGVAVLSLGVGIGAATATLALRDALFTNPPPLYANPAQLSVVRVHLPDRPRASVVPRLYRAWAEDRSLAGALAAASAGRPADARTGDRRADGGRARRHGGSVPRPRRRACPRTTFAGTPATGPPPVLLSHRLWQLLFDERPDVLGATLWLNDEAHTVIGVLPQHFWFASLDDPVWTLADIRTLAPETALDVVVRREPGPFAADLARSTAGRRRGRGRGPGRR